MKKIYVLLGSNMGNSRHQLAEARNQVEQQLGPITNMSSVYQTAAWGKQDQPDFLNQVVEIDTDLSPAASLASLLNIEKQMGRTRLAKNEPRIIDLDILFYSNEVVSMPNLTVPHPLLQDRRFVLVPMVELAPAFIHPVLNKSMEELLRICTDTLDVKKN